MSETINRNRLFIASCFALLTTAFAFGISLIRKKRINIVFRANYYFLLGNCRALLKELGNSLAAIKWDPGVVPLEQLPVLKKMATGDRLPWRAFRFGQGE